MHIIHKTYRFELKPNFEQTNLLNQHVGCVRFIYNYHLNKRQQQYKLTKKSDNYYTQANNLIELKRQLPWLKQVNSQSLQQTLKHLDVAYKNFFKKTAKHPKFKKKNNKNSFLIPQHIKLIDDKLHIPKFKDGIKTIVHRDVLGEIKQATITKTSTNRYFVSILTEQNHCPQKSIGSIIGLDLGIRDLVITSNEEKYPNNRFTLQYQKILKSAQKNLSRKKVGSNRFKNQKLNVAKIHQKISNCREDYLHKISRQIVDENDIICIEDLHVKGMIKNRKLSKHIADCGWNMFVGFLKYKCDWDKKQLIKINRFQPSSKICHLCGDKKEDLTLNDRTWTCINGHNLDRDINAANNILKFGMELIENTHREIVSHITDMQISLKCEAQQSLVVE